MYNDYNIVCRYEKRNVKNELGRRITIFFVQDQISIVPIYVGKEHDLSIIIFTVVYLANRVANITITVHYFYYYRTKTCHIKMYAKCYDCKFKKTKQRIFNDDVKCIQYLGIYIQVLRPTQTQLIYFQSPAGLIYPTKTLEYK